MRALGKITVKNLTTLTDFSALIRAGMFLAGRTDEAEEGGFRFEMTSSEVATVIRITEK